MAVKEYFMAWCSLLLTAKAISGMSSRETVDMWTLLEQVMYQGLRKNEREETRDDESLHRIHVSLWTFYILSLLSFLIFALSQFVWTATSNIRRKSLADREMPVSAEEKEKNKGTDKGLSSRKEEQRRISLHDEPMYDSTVGFSRERMKQSNEAKAHENTLKVKKKKNRRKKSAEPDLTDDADVWQIVKKKDKKKNTPEEVQEKDVKGKYTKTEPFTNSKFTKRRGNNGGLKAAAAARNHSRERLRQQWQEETVQVQVEVPPGRRHHVIGKQGEAMRKLREKYPAVRVSVPRKEDLVTAHLSLDGPKSQVAAAQRDILGHLQAIDKEIHETEQRRKANMTTISLEVDPKMRRYVVGPRGKRLGRLAEEHPRVRVSVPPSDDTNSRSVTLKGPKEEVALVKDTIMAHLKATESQICEAARRQATNIVVVSMEVEPENRRFIVGRGGERLVRLGQHHPRVRVTVPPADDTNTRSVTLRGPAEEVAAVQASLKDTLLKAQRQLEAEAKRKTKLREAQRLPQAQTRRM